MIMRAAPTRCFEVVTDFEHYPDWAADIKAVQVVERDDEGRAAEVAFRAAAFGRSTSYTLRYDYAKAPAQVSWVQVKGDITSKLDGTYHFEPSGDDTEVVYHLVAELKVPIPGFVKRRAQGRIMNTALRHLKARVESRAGTAGCAAPGSSCSPGRGASARRRWRPAPGWPARPTASARWCSRPIRPTRWPTLSTARSAPSRPSWPTGSTASSSTPPSGWGRARPTLRT